MKTITLKILASMLLAAPALAQWPTTIHNNLPVATDPNVYEGYPIALSYSGDRTFVIFETAAIGVCYQIILPNGAMLYPQPQSLSPAHYIFGIPKVIRDGQGGGFVAYDNWMELGMRAQRLDSQGNLLWGDSGVVAISQTSHDFAICSDGQGGIFYTMSTQPPPGNQIYGQHLNGAGQPLWEPAGRRLMASNLYYPKCLNMAQAPGGDFYLTWEDNRTQVFPYDEGTYRQRFSREGVQMWAENGLYIGGVGPGANTYKICEDGRGGFIFYSPGMYGGVAWRFAPNGSQLWMLNTGGSVNSTIIPGEPGYFYIWFQNDAAIKVQKLNLMGQQFWGPNGIPLERSSVIYGGYSCGLAYQFPYLYATFQSGRHGSWSPPLIVSVQKVDATGQLLWNDNSTIIASYNSMDMLPQYMSIAPLVGGGAVSVWQVYSPPLYSAFDVWAKRVNANGSMGGPWESVPVTTSSEFTLEVMANNGIQLNLSATQDITLELFDLLGRKVELIYKGMIDVGIYTIPVKFNHLPSGIYLLRVAASNQIQVKKIVILN